MKENWFIACLFLVVTQCHYLKTATRKMEETFLNFSDEGLITDETRIPNCGNGSRINLLEYNYQLRNCIAEDQICHSSYTEPFLKDQEHIIYGLCSFREKCLNMSRLNPAKNQKNRTNVMYVGYQCLDHTSHLIDICKAENTYINGTVHLIATDIANLYTECQCFVTRSSFSLFLNDVRLQTSEESACSGTELKINNIYYSCNNNSGQFGLVFRERFREIMAMAFISVSSLNDPPQMIWLTVQPSGYVSITCEGSTWGNTTNATASTAWVPTVLHSINNATTSTTWVPTVHETDTSTILPTTVSAVTVLLVAAISTTCGIIVVSYRKRSKLSGKTNTRSGEIPADNVETTLEENGDLTTIDAQTPMGHIFHRQGGRQDALRNLTFDITGSFREIRESDSDVNIYWEIGNLEELNASYYEQLDHESEQKDTGYTETHSNSKELIKDICNISQQVISTPLEVLQLSSDMYVDGITDKESNYVYETNRHSNGYMQPIYVSSQERSTVENIAGFEKSHDSDYLLPVYNHCKDILHTVVATEVDTPSEHYYSDYLQPIPDHREVESLD